jgi:NaMN:DMB phosphoribosyltransferase
MKRPLPPVLLIAALLLAACNDAPMQPESPATSIVPTAARFSVATSSGSALGHTRDFDRITADVIPGFKDADAAGQFKTYLGDISAALAAGNKTEANRLIGLARATLTPTTINDGDRGYVELVLRDLSASLAQ